MHWSNKALKNKDFTMTLVCLLLGFAGITGAAIAKDDFAKFEAPNKEASKEH